ncbi:hypothetical protein JJC00_03350 [Bradyrhizobium diazoefficiens]|uniref:hypothetical protein n=1 Tax=Bradyrhizobium diazoefficiens TaxID=1355477 RepID=UPI0019097747|nr:hypothetical protein [Bradyrhizobium diazoefficiens]QQO34754.1 hypothetical protein JJC00_03350 [Bradyrhizobium diazoefficiens]
MRKLILIATMSLLVTQAYAGGSRSLSLAATNASQATEQPATQPQANQAPTATPPASVQTATTTPASTSPAAPAQTVTAAQPAAAPVAETAKPKHRQPSTEARVIRELHRHGIYW